MLKQAVVIGLVLAGLFLAGCQTTPVQDGILVGGALGAGYGALVGSVSGHTGEGALIGAGVGAVTGALIGDQYEKVPTTTVHRHPVHPRPVRGYWTTRIVRGPYGETYEERVFVPTP